MIWPASGVVRAWTVCGATVMVLAAAAAQAQTPLWSDEFTASQLDTSIWTFDVGGSGNGNSELQFYSARPENVRVSAGDLVITALREKYIGNANAFTSARIKTQGRLAVLYGGIEMRVKVPDLREGLWPAGWMLGADIGQSPWPGCCDIDILEIG